MASLSDYNAGRLHGIWVDALDADDIFDAVQTMLAESPEAATPFSKKWGLKAEEWAIHDYEGFSPIRLSEWEQFETVAALGSLIDEHGAELISAAMDASGEDDPEKLAELCEGAACYLSWHDAAADLVETFNDELERAFGGNVPYYIAVDEDAIARDLRHEAGYVESDDGHVYYFPEIN